MKMKIVLLGLLAVLMTTGSTCVNNGFLVAVNLPISATFGINPGSTTSWSANNAVTVKFSDQIDESYRNKIQNARFYDIRVSVAGDYAGNIQNGVATIDGVQLLTFSGSWAAFKTPQSLLGSSTLIQMNPQGLQILDSKLRAFATQPDVQVVLASSGSLSQGPVPAGLTVTVEVLAQVDAQVNGGND